MKNGWTHLPVGNNDNNPPLTHASRFSGSCWSLHPNRPLEGNTSVRTHARCDFVDRNVANRSWDDSVVVHP